MAAQHIIDKGIDEEKYVRVYVYFLHFLKN